MTRLSIPQFSVRTCCAWFAVPFLTVLLLVLLIFLLACRPPSAWQSLKIALGLVLGLAPVAAKVGTTGLFLYFLTFWIPYGRHLWLSAAISAMIFGSVFACFDYAMNFDGDRGEIIPFTKVERIERDKYWQDAYLTGAFWGGIVGWTGALVFTGCKYLVRRKARKQSELE